MTYIPNMIHICPNNLNALIYMNYNETLVTNNYPNENDSSLNNKDFYVLSLNYVLMAR